MKRIATVMAIVLSLGATVVSAQNSPDPQRPNTMPIYRVTVVARTIKAINYRNRSQVTKVTFRGTSLLPEAIGDADVQSKQGAIRVDAKFKHLQPASRFGPEYMTFVLWAISPEGRPINLGEVLPDRGGNAALNVTSDLQAFGLIVTAEPHFAVTQPSDVVVMENFVTEHTTGTVEDVEAKYELLKRGQYTAAVNASDLTPLPVDERTPIEVNEARNAIRIARWAGADTYAADTLQKAELDLRNAEDLLRSKGNRKDLITDAREAAQVAEDARIITIRKMEAEEQARQRAAALAAQAQSQADSAAAAEARAKAERAEQLKAQSEAAQQAAEAQARQSQQAAEQAQLQAMQAEKEKLELRARLQQQLNSILQTRDTARGLIMNMSDVLFDIGKYTLKPTAREKLAKLAGIVLAHAGLNLEIDGYTDSVGSDEFNQTLSEERAGAVRDYLTGQGVPAEAVTAKGFGKTNPVASNDTAQGREQNRRVELVVSGDAIKAQPGSSPAGTQ